jgi:hypothetical protein
MDDLASKHSNLVHSLKFDSYDDFIETLFLNEEYINLSNAKGETLLHYACYLGLIEKYYALFNFGCEFKNTIEDLMEYRRDLIKNMSHMDFLSNT